MIYCLLHIQSHMYSYCLILFVSSFQSLYVHRTGFVQFQYYYYYYFKKLLKKEVQKGSQKIVRFVKLCTLSWLCHSIWRSNAQQTICRCLFLMFDRSMLTISHQCKQKHSSNHLRWITESYYWSLRCHSIFCYLTLSKLAFPIDFMIYIYFQNAMELEHMGLAAVHFAHLK